MAERRAFPKSVQAGIPKLSPKPDGWKTYALGDLLEVVERPVRLDAEKQYQLVTAKRNRGGIVERGRLRGRSIKTATQSLVNSGDFLISRRQIAHGACGIVPSHLNNAVVSNEYATLRPTDLLDVEFLKYLANTIYFQQTCFHSSIGVHVEKLVFNLEHWMTWQFHLPSVPEQRRITAVLSEWDRAIDAAERLIEAKQVRNWSLADKMIFDAPSEVRIGDIAVHTSDQAGEKFESYDVLSCTKHDGLVLSDEYFDRQVYSNDRRKYKIVLAGEFAYATNHLEEGSIGQNISGVAGIVSPMYTTFRAKEVDALYLRLVLKTERLRREFERRTPASVSRRGGLRWSDFAEVHIPMHPANRQATIAERLLAFENELEVQTKLADKWRNQKRGLMQKLLSGDLPVPASIDRLLPGGQEVDEAVGAEVQRAEATG